MENINFAELKGNKKEIRNTHINTGTGKDISIKELAALVQEIVQYEGKVIWDNSKPDGTPQKLLDVDKLNELGWKERVVLEDGIKKVYHSYKKGV